MGPIAPDARIAIVGGGTLGHTLPGLAIAEILRERGSSVLPLFLGVAGGVEEEAVRSRGFPFVPVPAAPFLRASPAGKLLVLPVLGRALVASRKLLRRERVATVLGLGGYVSAAPLLAARSLGLGTAIHEANTRAGLTNRLLGRVVHRVYLGFTSAAADFPANPPPRVVGNPVRAEVAAGGGARSVPARAERRILVIGGSEGSRLLNHRMPGVLARLGAARALSVRHQTGALPTEGVETAYRRAGIAAAVTRFLDDVAEAYAWADVAVTPAGASTLAELAICGLPALVVPRVDVALDHQTDNARSHAAAGAGLCVDPRGFDEEDVAGRLAHLLESEAWQRASANAWRLASPAAAAAIARDLEMLCSERRSAGTSGQ